MAKGLEKQMTKKDKKEESKQSESQGGSDQITDVTNQMDDMNFNNLGADGQ